MARYHKYVHLIVFIILVVMTFNISTLPADVMVNKPSIHNHKQQREEDALYKEIQEKAASFREAPQDAYIDRVWKKTPGRNGIEVDIEKSYEKMKKNKVFDDRLLVYKEIPPAVSIQDLPPAPIYRGHPDKDMVAFLINVSWGTEYIPDILNILKEHKVKASFFIEGKWAQEHPDLVKMIAEQGHVIGNHAYNHPDMARLNYDEIEKQIIETNEILQAIIDESPSYFTPPSGSFNDLVVEAAAKEGMETILWTTDTIDWKKPSVSVMINRVTSKVHPGAIILMHPTPVVTEGLDELIKQLKEKDYRIGRIDTLLSTDR